MKACTRCGETKPLSEFPRNATRRDGYEYRCSTCRNELARRWMAANRDKCRAAMRAYRQREKAAVLAHYGTRCACCRSADNLTIDHIDGNGREHRMRVGRGSMMYHWLLMNGFPSGFQTLCFRCNRSKGRGERCTLPHAEMAAS